MKRTLLKSAVAVECGGCCSGAVQWGREIGLGSIPNAAEASRSRVGGQWMEKDKEETGVRRMLAKPA